MQSDRELLELAAKAAGITYEWDGWADAPMVLTEDRNDTRTWNPLTDDGEALRLAVARWIEIRVFNGKSHAGKQGEFWCTEDCGLDPNAATRRAIVRAAAQIGATHPSKDGGAA